MKDLKPCQNESCINYHPEYKSNCCDLYGELSTEWIQQHCRLYQPEIQESVYEKMWNKLHEWTPGSITLDELWNKMEEIEQELEANE